MKISVLTKIKILMLIKRYFKVWLKKSKLIDLKVIFFRKYNRNIVNSTMMFNKKIKVMKKMKLSSFIKKYEVIVKKLNERFLKIII